MFKLFFRGLFATPAGFLILGIVSHACAAEASGAAPTDAVSDVDRQFWAFQPLEQPTPPEPRGEMNPQTPVDAFLSARLAARGLSFSGEADRVTLIRRLSLDLLGLPPSPEEVDCFAADSAPDAYERLVDRLLASLHFGERWGRHWLDVAGYADTVGFDIDSNNIITSEGKWLYRDYVIRAFNDDKPFDRFIKEQLAGDELYDWRRAQHLSPEMREALIATGYLRTARDLTHEDVGVIPQNFHNIVHDTLEIVGSGLLGLTVNCARCHDHKFDPIPQEDYYRLTALLKPAYNPQAWRPVIPFAANIEDRALADAAPAEVAEWQRENREIDAQVESLAKQLAELRRPYHERLFADKLATLPEAIRGDVKAALETPPDKRSEIQKYLAEKLDGAISVKTEEIAAALSKADKSAAAALEANIAETKQSRRRWGKIQALWDLGPPPPTHRLLRGDHQTPGEEVSPGFLRVLCRSEAQALASLVPPNSHTSGRRSARGSATRWRPKTRTCQLT